MKHYTVYAFVPCLPVPVDASLEIAETRSEDTVELAGEDLSEVVHSKTTVAEPTSRKSSPSYSELGQVSCTLSFMTSHWSPFYSSVVLVRSLHFSYGLVTVCRVCLHNSYK